jgi:hypothetical protein
MKRIYKIIAPIFFIVIITGGFTKNMEFPVTKFIISVIFGSSIYSILVLLKKEHLFSYLIGFFILILLITSYIESIFYIEFLLGLIVLFIWSLFKKYLNNFKLYKR